MTKKKDVYVSSLVERNASIEMAELFGAQKKFSTWRRLWLELAKAQKKLGLDIKQGQINQMARHLGDIDFAKAARYEKKFRHDVMAHVHTFADAAPKAPRGRVLSGREGALRDGTAQQTRRSRPSRDSRCR